MPPRSKKREDRLNSPSQKPNPKALQNIDPAAMTPSLVRKQIEKTKEELPHLYGWKWYSWAKEFFECRNKMALLVAANQISKSSTLIRTFIEWAGNPKLWAELWPPIGGVERKPKMFWYFYPSLDVATVEFEKKWVPEFMPRGDMKDHSTYGWSSEYGDKGKISAIHFRSGVSIYFKTYAQKPENLQTATIDAVGADEEMGEEFVDEVLARLVATNGYFRKVFTATIGQQIWYQAMECVGSSQELFSHAWKRCISMYDCQVYEDGTPGAWPLARIKEREKSCTSESERLKRVMGRFVKDEGRRYAGFSAEKNICEATDIPKSWLYYAGVDIGSGGSRHRSCGAITIVAVDPEYRKGRIVRTWRGDHEETTAGDILQKYLELRKGLAIMQAAYDYGSREFGLIAQRLGIPFLPADKGQESGEQTMNSLFRARALMVDDGAYDNPKLVTELSTVPANKAAHRKVRDDLSDATRYVLKLIPWDFAKIGIADSQLPDDTPRLRSDPTVPDIRWTPAEHMAWEFRMRRGEIAQPESEEQEFYAEIEAYNEDYGT